MVAYPPSLTARIYNDYTFGVWQHAEGSLPLNAQSVLYSVINLHGRLPTSSFTRNLLLPNSIGLSPLYPARPSDCRSATVRSSTHLSTGFNLARHRSSGFRSSTIDSKRAHFVPHSKLLRTCRFPFGYGDQLLNLANDQDSLGHFSKRTNRRCSYLRFHAYSACTHLVSRSFHIPLRILFSFHSRYL